MPRRKTAQSAPAVTKPVNQIPPDPAPEGRLLIVEGDSTTARTLHRFLSRAGLKCDFATQVSEGLTRLRSERYDVIVAAVSLPDGPGIALKSAAEARDRTSRVVLVAPTANYDSAIGAMREGVADVLAKPLSEHEVISRLTAIVQQVTDDRRRERRLERLKLLCRRLNSARQDMSLQMDSLCQDLVHAYQELSDQIAHVSVVTEFATIIRQELDVEELLRTTLECFLRKFGPMNAAVFLPGIDDDEFSLGAYVNYSCPRQSADLLLEHLADVMTPPMLEETRVLEFTDAARFNEHFGEGAEWMAENHILVFSCHHDDECLAVFTLFRDLQTAFPPEMATLMRSMVEIFGRQMSLVIRVHHRHLPEEEWPGSGHHHHNRPHDDQDDEPHKADRTTGRSDAGVADDGCMFYESKDGQTKRRTDSKDDDASPDHQSHFEDSADFDPLASDDAHEAMRLLRELESSFADDQVECEQEGLLDATDVDLPASYPFPMEAEEDTTPTDEFGTNGRASRESTAADDNIAPPADSSSDACDDDERSDEAGGLAA